MVSPPEAGRIVMGRPAYDKRGVFPYPITFPGNRPDP